MVVVLVTVHHECRECEKRISLSGAGPVPCVSCGHIDHHGPECEHEHHDQEVE